MEGTQLKECQITFEELPFGDLECRYETEKRREIRCKKNEVVDMDDLRKKRWELNCQYWRKKED